jgi:hypothetical protein
MDRSGHYGWPYWCPSYVCIVRIRCYDHVVPIFVIYLHCIHQYFLSETLRCSFHMASDKGTSSIQSLPRPFPHRRLPSRYPVSNTILFFPVRIEEIANGFAIRSIQDIGNDRKQQRLSGESQEKVASLYVRVFISSKPTVRTPPPQE